MLKQIKKTQSYEAVIGNKTILYSYQTIVAVISPNGYFKTNRKWSVTTSKHINAWFNVKRLEKLEAGKVFHIQEVNQDELEKMIGD